MITLSEHNVSGAVLASGTALDPESINRWYPRIQGIRWNYVIRAIERPTTNSNDISNPTDRSVLKAIRTQSDLIITTGKTARAENLKSSKLAPILIITRDYNLDIPATQQESALPVYLLGVRELSKSNNPNLAIIGGNHEEFWNEISEIKTRYQSIVLESGLSLAKSFIEQNLLDELNITVTDSNRHSVAKTRFEEFLTSLDIKVEILQTLSSETTWFFRALLKRRI